MTILTKNFADLSRQVAEHVAADQVVQGTYWDNGRGCFIGCLSHSSDPSVAVERFGLTLPLLRIAEGIFEALPADEARGFFASLPGVIGCDGKDLSRVHWAFLAAELRALPVQMPEIDAVIQGMDLLASGEEWAAAADADAAWAAHADADAAWAARADADAADAAAAWAARAAAAAWAARAAADAAADAAWAAHAAADAWAARAAAAAWAARAAARRRQRDTLLRLISEAPVVQS